MWGHVGTTSIDITEPPSHGCVSKPHWKTGPLVQARASLADQFYDYVKKNCSVNLLKFNANLAVIRRTGRQQNFLVFLHISF